MNRTDRLYALVEALRTVAPRPRTAQQLAARFEVSVRTVERDLGALLEAGVPILTRTGPGGGYALDKAHTLPPVNFTPDEATALAIAPARPARCPRSRTRWARRCARWSWRWARPRPRRPSGSHNGWPCSPTPPTTVPRPRRRSSTPQHQH